MNAHTTQGGATAPTNLAEALIAFQSSVPTIQDNDESYHGKFANLPGILSTINPHLRAAGLFVSQLPAETDHGPGLRTTLMHISGDSITDITPLCISTGKNATQEWGKAMTYTRRYALQSVLGLCVGIEDNDADAEPSVPPVVAVNPQGSKVVKDVAQKLANALDAEVVAMPVTVDEDDPSQPLSKAEVDQCIKLIKGKGGQELKAAFMKKYLPDAEALYPEDFKTKAHLAFLTNRAGDSL